MGARKTQEVDFLFLSGAVHIPEQVSLVDGWFAGAVFHVTGETFYQQRATY